MEVSVDRFHDSSLAARQSKSAILVRLDQ